MSFIYSICAPIIITTRLNCSEVLFFLWFFVKFLLWRLLLCWYKRYNICLILILLFTLYELFPASGNQSFIKTFKAFKPLSFSSELLKVSYNVEYLNLLIVAAFTSKSFSGKKSFPVRNSHLVTLPGDKAEILAVSLSKLYWVLIRLNCYQLF